MELSGWTQDLLIPELGREVGPEFIPPGKSLGDPSRFFKGFGDHRGDTVGGVSDFMAVTRGCLGWGRGEGLPQLSSDAEDSTVMERFLSLDGILFILSVPVCACDADFGPKKSGC